MTKSKQLLSAWGAACLALGSMANSVSADTFGKFEYEDGATITITGYIDDNLGMLVIPASINGKPVTRIGEFAFRSVGMSRVFIPSGVTRIDSYAFVQCVNLTSAVLPSGLTHIDTGAFQRCSSLNNVVFTGNAPTLGASVFENTPKLFKVYFVTGVQGFTAPLWQGYRSAAMPMAPEITIQQPAGTGTADGASRRKFGKTKVGATGKPRTFTILNEGAKSLTGLKVSKDGAQARDFIITAPKLIFLAPGGSTTFTVTFKPRAKGTRNAAIHIRSNDANENPFDIKLTGTGI